MKAYCRDKIEDIFSFTGKRGEAPLLQQGERGADVRNTGRKEQQKVLAEIQGKDQNKLFLASPPSTSSPPHPSPFLSFTALFFFMPALSYPQPLILLTIMLSNKSCPHTLISTWCFYFSAALAIKSRLNDGD